MVVDLIFVVASIVLFVCGGYVWSLFCYALLSFVSSGAIISLGNMELVAFF